MKECVLFVLFCNLEDKILRICKFWLWGNLRIWCQFLCISFKWLSFLPPFFPGVLSGRPEFPPAFQGFAQCFSQHNFSHQAVVPVGRYPWVRPRALLKKFDPTPWRGAVFFPANSFFPSLGTLTHSGVYAFAAARRAGWMVT
eukprot:EG_transcript_15866